MRSFALDGDATNGYELYREIDNLPVDADHKTPKLYQIIDELRAEITRLKSNGRPDIQDDAEKLYYWLSDLYSLLDRFPEFEEGHKAHMQEAIVDCRELIARCREAFDDYGVPWLVELEIHFGGQSE